MDYFLQIFGEYSIEWLVAAIGAIIFLVACYKKVESYISEKTIREKEKDEKIHQVIEQAEQYPKWHQQSIDIRENIDNTIEGVNKKLDSVSKTLDKIRTEIQENRATTCRYRILRFDDEIRHEEKHSKEHFDQILEDITEYERYCKEHPDYENNKAVLAIENIEKTYRTCTDENKFL